MFTTEDAACTKPVACHQTNSYSFNVKTLPHNEFELSQRVYQSAAIRNQERNR